MADLWALAINASPSLSESELHGMVCGAAVAAQGRVSNAAITELVGTDQVADIQALSAFIEAVVEDFYRADLRFHPLLPGAEEASLEARVMALAEWCASFLAGIGSTWVSQPLPEDAEEALRDLAAISAMDRSPEPGEESERQLVEIEEYVKVAALLLQSLLNEEA